ncbi:hypothetical protein E2C01_048381 [Portunus trituberculatus]|uniref:Uncharacterized protein n=1 Tax=Portunus trituberculatus TaxID=210409 RepID=A0A5B7GD79_PORTR|nr:hypothetical protein [Portunus trituberculatus]
MSSRGTELEGRRWEGRKSQGSGGEAGLLARNRMADAVQDAGLRMESHEVKESVQALRQSAGSIEEARAILGDSAWHTAMPVPCCQQVRVPLTQLPRHAICPLPPVVIFPRAVSYRSSRGRQQLQGRGERNPALCHTPPSTPARPTPIHPPPSPLPAASCMAGPDYNNAHSGEQRLATTDSRGERTLLPVTAAGLKRAQVRLQQAAGGTIFPVRL